MSQGFEILHGVLTHRKKKKIKVKKKKRWGESQLGK
jgi:hypothetical protein